jgi:hypothetical protein
VKINKPKTLQHMGPFISLTLGLSYNVLQLISIVIVMTPLFSETFFGSRTGQ